MAGPVRVLLVEDDEDDYVLTRALLSEIPGGGYDLEWAPGYAAGLAAMQRNAHDVYLLDYRLDGRTGLELLREAAARGCRGPFILLTGQGEREVDLEAMRAGAADFLVKAGLDAALLERSLRYALTRHRDQEALRRFQSSLEERVHERTAALAAANRALQLEITERKRAEEALKEAARRKDEYLAMLAHELRNPLAPVLNAVHILRSPAVNPGIVAKSLDMMDRQLRHLKRLVDDLLDVSRVTRGKIPLRRERLDLARLVRAAADDHRAAFEQAGLAFTAEAPAVPVWVMGDGTRLTQVLDNLLGNALKFTDRGGRVAVRLAADRAAGQAVLAVRDTGIGIEPDVLSRLFEPFTQADQSLERSRGGLGLGLALVKALVDLHGGELRAESAGPGRGAEFTIRLPVLAEPAALTRMPVAGTTRPPGRRLRILVVEDNQDTADSLRVLLELLGHEAAVAYTGPAGVEAARRCPPDVVLCDIGLPGLDGYGVAEALRSNPSTAGARLIALTGYGQDEDCRRSRQAGFEHHLVKPADPDVLQALLASRRAPTP